MKRSKKEKSKSLRERLNEAIRDMYPRNRYLIEFQYGIIGGVRRHQYFDNSMWKWDANLQDWKGGRGFGRIKNGDSFCLQIGRKNFESERIWGWESGNYLEDHIYVTIENGDFKLKRY